MRSGAREHLLVAAYPRTACRFHVRAGYGNIPLSVSGLSALRRVRKCASILFSFFITFYGNINYLIENFISFLNIIFQKSESIFQNILLTEP